MRAISLSQPWASLVVSGQKRYETRSWPSVFRGPIAIHATRECLAAYMPLEHRQAAARALGLAHTIELDRLPRSALLGVATVADIYRTDQVTPVGPERLFGDFGPDRFAWLFEAPHRAAQPVPCRGWQGIWRVPDPAARALEIQLSPTTTSQGATP